MLSKKQVRQIVRDNKKNIGFTQFYFAPHQTFKEVYLYHYDPEWNRTIQRAKYDDMVDCATKLKCKLKCTKHIYKKYDNPTPTPPVKVSYKKIEQDKQKQKSIIIMMPDGKKYAIKQELKPRKVIVYKNDANAQILKYIKGNRFETTEIKS